ncbi:MAG: exodeoxyribonuclease VII small subunit [Candidatus Fimenecus sp.]
MKKNFEASLKRLEEISKLLENNSLSLDESIELFSEGTELVKLCKDYLNKAELKITELVKNDE